MFPFSSNLAVRPVAGALLWLLAGMLVGGAGARAGNEAPAEEGSAGPPGFVMRMGTLDTSDDDGHQGTIYDLLFSPGGNLLASHGADDTIRIWSIPEGKELHRLAGGRLLAFSPDGAQLLIGEATLNNPGTQLWDIAQGKQLWKLPGRWEHAAFNREGTQIRYIYRGRIHTVDVATHTPVDQGKLAPSAVKAISRRGDLLAWVSSLNSKQLRLVDTDQGHAVRELAGNSDIPATVAFSDDGRSIAAAGRDNSIHVWEVATGKLMGVLIGHEKPAQKLDFSADGRLLASAGRDGTARLWEIISGNSLVTLEAAGPHDTDAARSRPLATAVAFSPSGQYLATGSTDSTIVLWDITKAVVNRPAEAPLTAQRLKEAWQQLAHVDALVGRKAMYALWSDPEKSLPFMSQRLEEILASPQEDHIRELIRDLDSDDYMVRERATQSLRHMLDVAADLLKHELRRTLSAEVRFRIRLILGSQGQPVPRFSQSDVFRFKRLIQVLEGLDSPEAVQLLKLLASDLPLAEIQDEAQRALARLGRSP